MKKILLSVGAVTIIGFGSPFFQDTTYAERNLQDIQSERAEIKANLSDAEKQIADLLIDLEEIEQEIEKVNQALKENQKMMQKTEQGIKDTEDKADKLQKEIEELEEAIEIRYNILKDRVASYQKNGGSISYLEVIFGSKSFGDFISRVTAVNKIADSDANLINQQKEDKKKVEAKQQELLDKLEELKEMKEELEGMQATIKEQKAQNEEKRAQLKSKQSELVALIEDLQIEDSRLATLEANIRQSYQPARNTQVASTSASNKSSGNKSGGQLKQLSNTSNGGGNLSTVVNAGFAHIGTPYVWGGKGPGGFDCSGFVSWAYAQGGYSIPSSTSALAGVGKRVSPSEMRPGDIVFFNTYKTNGHVGIYIGNNQFIGAQDSGLGVASMNNSYWKSRFNQVRRVVN